MTAETRAELTELPWSSIVGMRNQLVHAYFDINRDILWTTVTEAAPPLVERISKVSQMNEVFGTGSIRIGGQPITFACSSSSRAAQS